MTLGQNAIWWTAFGAIAQAVGAAATFAAVAVSLWIAGSERALRGRGRVSIMMEVPSGGGEMPFHLCFNVENTGLRDLRLISLGWDVGWLKRGPKALRREMSIQTFDTSLFVSKTIPPSLSETISMPLPHMKSGLDREKSGDVYFWRRLPALGFAPIRAFAHVAGRRPIRLKVDAKVAAFLRTGEHPDEYAGPSRRKSDQT